MGDPAEHLNEEAAVLVGQRRGRIWHGRLRQHRVGAPASVEFDWAWVLEQEERRGDVIGFYHTHPSGLTTPSERDVRTMRAWVSCLGKPLLCVIETSAALTGYLFATDEDDGRPLAEAQRLCRDIVIVDDMRDAFYHEVLYRGADALARLGQVRLTVCGAGAVGSNLVDNLVRQGVRQVTVIDSDRVEAHNIGTQTYAESDVGAFKVEVLQAEVFRAVGVEITAVRQRLTERNVSKLLAKADLVIDGFDNHVSRALVTEHCRATGIPCLHVGLSADYAEVIWNEDYRVPQDVADADVCDYPMARNLIQFAVALASEAVVRFVLEGQKQGYSFTLRDLRINMET